MEHVFQIRLIFGTSAVLAAYEAMKANKWQRVAFCVVALAFGAIALGWQWLHDLYAPATQSVTAIAISPATWVVLFALIMAAIWASAHKQHGAAKGASTQRGGVLGFAESVPAVDPIEKQLSDLEVKLRGIQNTLGSRDPRIGFATKGDLDSSLKGFQGGMEAVWRDINDIKRQIRIELPNAGTVVEAFSNLDDAVAHKVNKIETSLDRVVEKVKWIGIDVRHLQTVACQIETITALERLESARPRIEDPADLTEKVADRLANYIAGAEIMLTALSRYADFKREMAKGLKIADEKLGNLPTQHYPSGTTPAVFRRRVVVREQFNALAAFLDKELQTVRKALIDYRANIVEGLSRGDP